MTNKQALDWAKRLLEDKDILTARLDALVLLEDNTNIDRAQILAEPEHELSPLALIDFKRQVRQRSRYYPLAYVRGKSEFYGRNFIINRHVLEPRPESETMIEEVISIVKDDSENSILDIGTGSGALIISAKLELPKINAYATDISKMCISLAKKNAENLHAPISFYIGDLIKPVPELTWTGQVLVMANLPYVPNNWRINPPAMREPKKAIFGGQDGLNVYKSFFSQLEELKKKPSWVLTEAMPPQHDNLSLIAKHAGYKLIKTNDFIQVYKA